MVHGRLGPHCMTWRRWLNLAPLSYKSKDRKRQPRSNIHITVESTITAQEPNTNMRFTIFLTLVSAAAVASAPVSRDRLLAERRVVILTIPLSRLTIGSQMRLRAHSPRCRRVRRLGLHLLKTTTHSGMRGTTITIALRLMIPTLPCPLLARLSPHHRP